VQTLAHTIQTLSSGPDLGGGGPLELAWRDQASIARNSPGSSSRSGRYFCGQTLVVHSHIVGSGDPSCSLLDTALRERLA
jgi:hypothetical protein